jgi:diguanylate cyclase (GGDEF)-like protein/PAS domain S-box-containing protein
VSSFFTSGHGSAWLRALIFGLIYFVLASATIMSTRFGGGVAFIWVATAVLLAELSILSPKNWVRPLITCGIASFVATSLFGFGLWAAGPLVLFNLSEAVIGAILLRRFKHRRGPLASLHDVASFVVAAGIVAPAISGLGGAAIAAVLGLDYWSNWASWFAGHALGTIAFAPIVGAILRSDARQFGAALSRQTVIENSAMIVLIVATDVAVFWNNTHPLLFLPILVVMMATIWRGQFGAGVSIVLLALIGGFFTVAGAGSTGQSSEAIAGATVFFQFYLAVTVLTILPVAADLTRRRLLHEKLLASEARYRLVTENSSDLILNLNPDGTILYASQSIAELGGYKADKLLGIRGSDLVLAKDRLATHAIFEQALEHPDQTFTAEFRGVGSDGTAIWFEMRCRGVFDEGGLVSGVVCSIRDIAQRKILEDQLTHDASTDFLTGLPNRRAFMRQLKALSDALSASNPGCVAIIDLDHFKSVNDRHGHLVGDEILVSFSQCASSVLRGADVIARIGGEEFGLIFTGANIEHATAICERLRSRIEAMVFASGSDHDPIKLTISAGVAQLKPGQLVGDVLAGADAALYRAKAAGRNRLALAA